MLCCTPYLYSYRNSSQVNDDYMVLPVERMGFMARGACRGMDPNLFFPEDGKRVPKEARAACDDCEVLRDCREWALEHEEFGFWGGLTASEREQLRRVRRKVGL